MDPEKLTIALPSELAAFVSKVVGAGEFASSSEVIEEALLDWREKRAFKLQALASLRADIAAGIADLAEGRVVDYDVRRISEQGRNLLASRSPSA